MEFKTFNTFNSFATLLNLKQITIDDHSLLVIASDGYDIQPRLVSLVYTLVEFVIFLAQF